MNKFLAMAALVLGVGMAGGAYAQSAGPTGGGVQQPGKQGGKQQPGKQGKKGNRGAGVPMKVLKELNLTPEQQTKVKALVTKSIEEGKKLRESGQKPDRKAMRAHREQVMKELDAILTPEQRIKLKDLMARAKDKIKDKAGSGPAKAGSGTTSTKGGGI